MGFEIVRLDHVQLAMPAGREAEAEAFYSGSSDWRAAQTRAAGVAGGCWFGDGPVVVHLGVEQDFRPARKAHPGPGGRATCPPSKRSWWPRGWRCDRIPTGPSGTGVYVDDPFGNRIELIAED